MNCSQPLPGAHPTHYLKFKSGVFFLRINIFAQNFQKKKFIFDNISLKIIMPQNKLIKWINTAIFHLILLLRLNGFLVSHFLLCSLLITFPIILKYTISGVSLLIICFQAARDKVLLIKLEHFFGFWKSYMRAF